MPMGKRRAWLIHHQPGTRDAREDSWQVLVPALATAPNDLFDIFRRIERLVRQDLFHRGNDLLVCATLLGLHNQLIFIQRIREGAQHFIKLAALVQLIIVNLHLTSSFRKYTRDFSWLMPSLTAHFPVDIVHRSL